MAESINLVLDGGQTVWSDDGLFHVHTAVSVTEVIIADMSPYSGCIVVSGVVSVVVVVCNRSQMRTNKCTCLIFWCE